MRKSLQAMLAKLQLHHARAVALANSDNEDIAERYEVVAEQISEAIGALEGAQAELG
jgi:hypothetical protein